MQWCNWKKTQLHLMYTFIKTYFLQGSLDLKIISMTYIFIIIFMLKLVSNLLKKFLCIARYQKPTVRKSQNGMMMKVNIRKTQYILWKWGKMGTLENQKSHFAILVLNQSPLSTIFSIEWLGAQNSYYLGTPCIFFDAYFILLFLDAEKIWTVKREPNHKMFFH